MGHWKLMTDRKYIFAADLKGKDQEVTIVKVEKGEVVGEGGRKANKPHAYFAGIALPLVLNATNCKTIAAAYGNDTEAWVGKKITLYPTTTQRAGQEEDCVRIRPPRPAPDVKGGA